MTTTAVIFDDGIDGAVAAECDVSAKDGRLRVVLTLAQNYELYFDIDDLLTVIGDEGHG